MICANGAQARSACWQNHTRMEGEWYDGIMVEGEAVELSKP